MHKLFAVLAAGVLFAVEVFAHDEHQKAEGHRDHAAAKETAFGRAANTISMMSASATS